MKIFGQIEKLINEHGSATILKERLHLAADKYSKLEDENAVLKEKIETLESNLDDANKEIERLNKVANCFQKEQSQQKLDEVTKGILRKFFEAGRDLPVRYFASALSLDIGIVQYHFDILRKHNFIIQATAGREATFELTPQGRKYFVEQINT